MTDRKESQKLRKEMINKGVEIVKKQGIENISIRKIAVDCGISHSSPYRHFKNKNELIKAILKKISSIFSVKLIQNIDFNQNRKEILSDMGFNFVQFASENPFLFDAMFLSRYIIPIKIKNKQLISDESLPGFDEFKQAVQKFSNENRIKTRSDFELTQLWSFILGFSVVISHVDIKTDDEWVKQVISSMIETYIKGNQVN